MTLGPGEVGILAPSPEETAEVSKQTLERKDSSHSERRSGRGSCLVSEWSPVAWEQELVQTQEEGPGK